MLSNKLFCQAIGALLLILLGSNSLAHLQEQEAERGEERWNLQLQTRQETALGSGRFHAVLQTVDWNPRETVVIVCDLWDAHHSPNATDRVNELAPRIQAFVSKARQAGCRIIHAPSDCLAFYEEHPARQRAREVPPAENMPAEFGKWCYQIPAEEAGKYPIDQTDGGEDDDPTRHAAWAKQMQAAGRNPRQPWLRQHPAVAIDPVQDYITDRGEEVWNILETHRIEQVLMVGVHVNMCVLGRPFGLRNLVTGGKQAVLVRDLTDSMYNPQSWPFVNHHTGTDLIVQHIERYVCPTTTSDQLLGGTPFRFDSDTRARLVMLIAEPEYETEISLPEFATDHLGQAFQVEYVFGSTTDPYELPGLHLLPAADVALFSIRRRPLYPVQMEIVRRFVESGRPMIGLRTASHAFHLGSNETPAGTEAWPGFDGAAWGGNYAGHYGNNQLPHIQIADTTREHPILQHLATGDFDSSGSLYKTSPLHEMAKPLASGEIPDQPVQPVAWTFTRTDGGRSFYTSLGHQGDFQNSTFQQLLLNAIYWAADKAPVEISNPKVPTAAPSSDPDQSPFWLSSPPSDKLPNTERLEIEGDVAAEMVAGVDRFLLKKLAAAEAERVEKFKDQAVTSEQRAAWQVPQRATLARLLGLPDEKSGVAKIQRTAGMDEDSLIGQTSQYEIHRVSWPAFSDVVGRGLLLNPTKQPIRGRVIALPDCEVSPEVLVGLLSSDHAGVSYANRLAENGCQVLIPLLINRREKMHGIHNREWLHRAAFVMGRGLLGYEVQEVLSAVDALSGLQPSLPVGIFGYGEGGLIGLYAGALDERVQSVVVCGYFGSRQNLWQEPLDRNVFGLLQHFDDAALAGLIWPRTLIVEASRGPEQTWSGGRGAPARLVSPPQQEVAEQWQRAEQIFVGLDQKPQSVTIEPAGEEAEQPGSEATLLAFFQSLGGPAEDWRLDREAPTSTKAVEEPAREHEQKMHELDRYTQRLLRDSRAYRDQHIWGQLDFRSLEHYEASTKPLRESFYEEVIGRFPDPLLPLKPRSRLFQETEDWVAYEVVVDVFPDVMAYGLLLIPKDLQPGERRPVVVCQHGLEGRPQDLIGEAGFAAYKAFASELAKKGYITFAPQNLYLFGDGFRTLQRKANPLGKTLFSIITPQHQQWLSWLKSLPYVDGEKIAFYGLSYGGKTAMRVPAILTDYCLSICSADFNEWVDKNASTVNPRSYVSTGEYEIFEFDLGHRFNYAEMAALIAPRPFMVERGHADGVADDWTVAWEYARVRLLYASRLKLPHHTEIEWFDGPHTIHGKGTFEFLQQHLEWPKN